MIQGMRFQVRPPARLALALAGLLGLAAAQVGPRVSGAESRNYDYLLASPPLDGRDTPSRGLDTAALFVASKLDEWGLLPIGANPAGDPLRRFFLPIALETIVPDLGHTSARMGTLTFVYGRDFAASGRFAGTAEGQLVFVGSSLAANIVDVRGKIMVVPPGMALDPAQAYAASHGAIGIVLLPGLGQIISMLDPDAAGLMMATNSSGVVAPHTAAAALRAPRLAMTRIEAADYKPSAVPAIVAGPVLLNALFNGEKIGATQVVASAALSGKDGKDGKDNLLAGFALAPDKVLRFSLAATATPSATEDVIGLLPGSDPSSKDEYVVITAHLDHLGPGFPGADDDGSGSAGLLAIAHAFAQGPRPRRSILFVWHAGEEKGLWGSEYLTRFPPVPIKQVVADLNMDMIGRSKPADDVDPRDAHLALPGEIYVIGPHLGNSALGAVLDQVNDAYLRLKLNYYWDRPDDPDRIYYRSDQYNYARAGVPIVFFTDGLHADYHQPTDTPDKLDYAQLEKVARTVAALAENLANRPRLPQP